MKLPAPFTQLPLLFDAERLAHEVAALGEQPWRPHPQGYAGNDFLPLLAVQGDPENGTFAGPMRPTPHLEKCPYVIDVLTALGAALGRTRFMRLSGHAEVSPHVDIHYYWRDHMRVHVPVVTQPTVTFYCGDVSTHMAAGECWIFDTWSLHRVVNDAERSRIHLVIDTVGSDGFFELVADSRTPADMPANWAPKSIAPFGALAAQLDLERINAPTVMSPWEARDHISFLLGEAVPESPGLHEVTQVCWRFLRAWRALWAIYGEAEEGRTRYSNALRKFVDALKSHRAETIPLRNGVDLAACIMSLVVNVALTKPNA